MSAALNRVPKNFLLLAALMTSALWQLSAVASIGATLRVSAQPVVQLLVPLESGHELDMLLPSTPQAQLVQMEGRHFVLLGRYQDARVAYRLGRTFQRRLRLPFELAYDHGHPDADGTWLASEPQSVHHASLARWLTAPAAPPPVEESSNPGRAEQLGGPLVAGRPTTQWFSSLPALPPLPASWSEPLNSHQSPIQAVAIAPVTRPSLAAVNPQLHYLFVRLKSNSDVMALKQYATVTEVSEQNGQLLARVGAYYPTPRGTQLLNRQSQLLSSLGFDVAVLTSSA